MAIAACVGCMCARNYAHTLVVLPVPHRAEDHGGNYCRLLRAGSEWLGAEERSGAAQQSYCPQPVFITHTERRTVSVILPLTQPNVPEKGKEEWHYRVQAEP